MFNFITNLRKIEQHEGSNAQIDIYKRVDIKNSSDSDDSDQKSSAHKSVTLRSE